jgi:hypothetical protein
MSESPQYSFDLQHDLLDSIDDEPEAAPTFASNLSVHGMYETMRFVLRLSPHNHELMDMIQANGFGLGDVPSEAIQAYSTSDRKAKRILLPVRSLQTWIEQNILLILKDAPFDKRDAHLVAIAGACTDCSKRTGHNKLLFADLGKQDACKLCGIWATATLSCWRPVIAQTA